MEKLVQTLRKKIEGVSELFTLDACRHGGMTRLEEAELTDGQGRALSGHKIAQAYRGYVKETMRRALTPSKTRDGKTNPYGLGWALFMDRSGRLGGFGHAGYWGGFRTDYHHDFGNDHTVVVLSNRGLGLDLDAMWFKFDALIRTYARA